MFFLDIPLKERREVELLEQVLKKASKIRSSSAVSSSYREKTISSVSTSKAPAVKTDDKRNPQKSSLSSSEVKGSRQLAGQLKSTAGCGDVTTRQILGKTGQSSQPATKGKQSGMKPFSAQKSTRASVQIKPRQMANISLEPDRGMMNISLLTSEEGTCHSGQELKKQSEGSGPKGHW